MAIKPWEIDRRSGATPAPPKPPTYVGTGNDIIMGSRQTGSPAVNTRTESAGTSVGGASAARNDFFDKVWYPTVASQTSQPSPRVTAPGPSGSSGGGRSYSYGGGGGGGAAGPTATPEQIAAYKALYEQMGDTGVWDEYGQGMKDVWDKYGTGMNDAWDSYESGMREAYDPKLIEEMFGGLLARNEERYDKAAGDTRMAGKAGQERLGGIVQAMDSRAARGRTATSQAYRQGDARLQEIANRFGGNNEAYTAGLSSLLGSHDAGDVRAEGQGALNELFANAQVANARMGTASDAAMADRNEIYGALQQDVSHGMTQQEQKMLNQIAMQRADQGAQLDFKQLEALRQNGVDLQGLLGQIGLGRVDSTRMYGTGLVDSAREAGQGGLMSAQDQAKLAIEMAGLGIPVPGLNA